MDDRGNDPAGVFSWGIDDDDLGDGSSVQNFFAENNENNYLFGEFTGASKDATLFLVDCTQSMFVQSPANADGDADKQPSLFEKCMKAIQNIYQSKIYGSDKDILGIVFYGTHKSNTSADFNCIYTFQDLDQPSAERIKQIEALSAHFDSKQFDSEYGHSEAFKLDQVLWWCSNMFSNITQKIRTKRIILFTRRDNPHESDKTLQKLAKNKAKDLNDVGIYLEIVPVILPAETFDFAKFYGDLLMLSDEEIAQLPDPAETFEELEKAVRSKDHKRRPYTNLKLNLGEGVAIACSVFNLVRECPKPSKIKLDKKTNVETKSVVRRFNPETGEILFNSDTKLAVDVFDKRIAFEQDEVKAIKNFGPTGLKLLGFKSIDSLEPFVFIKPGHFLYPDEKLIEGSTTLFKCLLDKTLEKGKYILCEMIARRFSPPRMVALIPQKEELDENRFQVSPPGFNVVYLPYADDYRDIERKIIKKKSENHVDLFSKVVNKLKFKYCPEDFKNPALLKLWSEIEAIALARESSEEVVDLTEPDVNNIDKRAGQFLEQFSATFNLNAAAPVGGSKRKTAEKNADDESGGLLKKPKIKEESDVATEARNGKLDKLTVAVLKQYLKDSNVTFGGSAKKDDLIRLVKKHLKLPS